MATYDDDSYKCVNADISLSIDELACSIAHSNMTNNETDDEIHLQDALMIESIGIKTKWTYDDGYTWACNC